MPSASQLYNTGRWLNASDLLPVNQRRTAIVHHCEPELIGQGGDQKTMLMLDLVSRQGQAWPKKLPLNKTNTMAMVTAYGDDYSAWPGKTIDVWAENVMFAGKMVPGIKLAAAANGSNSSNGNGQQQALPPANPSPSATAVTGMPPAAEPNWQPPRTANTAPIEDDEIPF